MGAAGGGALLRSASLDMVLQRHRYRIKDWRYSPAAQVCDFHFVEMAAAACFDFVAFEEEGNGSIVEMGGFALPLPVGDALCSYRSNILRLQRC
jgi:hypothetical protein